MSKEQKQASGKNDTEAVHNLLSPQIKTNDFIVIHFVMV